MGAADLVRSTFEAARGALGPTGDRLQVLNDVVNGSRQLALHVQTQAEIDSALDLCEGIGIKPILVGCEQGQQCLDRIATLAAGVVLAPHSFASSPQQLGLPAELEAIGIPFSFMAERPADLRIAAALAVRHGTSRRAALAALTQTAAEHIESADRVGNLREGKSADLCIFSGDPLDLTSRLIGVYVAGIRVVTPAEAK
jgi:imidazolonepropionase-like amidohydrolase